MLTGVDSMMQVDPAQVTIPGSRWPIVLPRSRLMDVSPALRQPTTLSTPTTSTPSLSAMRRKPKFTYRSPDADSPLPLDGEPRITASTSMPAPSSQPSSSNTTVKLSFGIQSTTYRNFSPIFKPAPPIFKMQPPLPVYHPLGPRHRATQPEHTHPEDINTDSNSSKGKPVTIIDESEGRRSSSRTRRPVAKLREGAEDTAPSSSTPRASGEDDANAETASVAASVANGTGKNGGSPKRKRANGAGGGNKRRRKEPAADRDTAYPNRRTRPQRTAALAAQARQNLEEEPEAETAGDDGIPMDVEDGLPEDTNAPGSPNAPSTSAVADGDDTKEPDAEPEPEPEPETTTRRTRTRARRSRNANAATADSSAAPTPPSRLRRRGSSASEATATSVSVSIAGALASSKDRDAPDAPAIDPN